MIIVREETCREIFGRSEAFRAVEAVFGAMARGDAYNFPVIREAIGHADALYGFKSGFDRAALVLGLKAGGYWPGNESRGLTNHQSTVFLFDADTGKPRAMVGGNYLTAIRTAAASAVSIKLSGAEGCQSARHGGGRVPVGVPIARGSGAARLREGDRLELPSGDAVAPRADRPRGRRAVRGRRSATGSARRRM